MLAHRIMRELHLTMLNEVAFRTAGLLGGRPVLRLRVNGLIRPDGYIGFRGQPAAEATLLRYLEKIFAGISSEKRLAQSDGA